MVIIREKRKAGVLDHLDALSVFLKDVRFVMADLHDFNVSDLLTESRHSPAKSTRLYKDVKQIIAAYKRAVKTAAAEAEKKLESVFMTNINIFLEAVKKPEAEGTELIVANVNARIGDINDAVEDVQFFKDRFYSSTANLTKSLNRLIDEVNGMLDSAAKNPKRGRITLINKLE